VTPSRRSRAEDSGQSASVMQNGPVAAKVDRLVGKLSGEDGVHGVYREDREFILVRVTVVEH
jgi:hypothetical protein